MNIINFTPIPAFIGGLLIGLAAGIFFLFNGRIFGISGVMGGLISPKKDDIAWRIVLLMGLVFGAFITHFVLKTPVVNDTRSIPLLIIGGFTVGIGVRMGSGCTSGHGVCGLSRGSSRSIAATIIFFSVAMLTTFILGKIL